MWRRSGVCLKIRINHMTGMFTFTYLNSYLHGDVNSGRLLNGYISLLNRATLIFDHVTLK